MNPDVNKDVSKSNQIKSWWEASLPGRMAASQVMPREGKIRAANSWFAMLVGLALLLPYCSNLPLK